MASIFEEMMTANQALTEAAHPEFRKKNKKTENRKFKANQIKVESRKYFEEGDLDELEQEFEIPEEEDAIPDEVVLVIDPEIPDGEEVPEDAAEDMVGDLVYKCPVCGSNYVCDCDEEGMVEGIEVDENGVPTECPICGDDAEQILVGEIEPADEVEDPEDDIDLPLQDVDDEDEDKIVERRKSSRKESRKRRKEDLDISISTDEDDNVESVTVEDDGEVVIDQVVDTDEVADDEEDEIIEERRKRGRRESRRRVKESDSSKFSTLKSQVSDIFKDSGFTVKDIDDDEGGIYLDIKTPNGYDSDYLSDLIDEVFNTIKKIYGYAEYCEDDCFNQYPEGHPGYGSVEGTIFYVPEDGFESKKRRKENFDTCEECEDDVMVLDVPEDTSANDAPDVVVTDSEVTLVLDDTKLEALMNKVMRENYKGAPSFKVKRVSTKNGKLRIEYIVRRGRRAQRGVLVGEGFNTKRRVMKLAIRDKGVFTESFRKSPIMVLECVNFRNKVVPTKLTYNYKVKVNENLYRVKGAVGLKKSVK